MNIIKDKETKLKLQELLDNQFGLFINVSSNVVDDVSQIKIEVKEAIKQTVIECINDGTIRKSQKETIHNRLDNRFSNIDFSNINYPCLNIEIPAKMIVCSIINRFYTFLIDEYHKKVNLINLICEDINSIEKLLLFCDENSDDLIKRISDRINTIDENIKKNKKIYFKIEIKNRFIFNIKNGNKLEINRKLYNSIKKFLQIKSFYKINISSS